MEAFSHLVALGTPEEQKATAAADETATTES